MGVNGEALQLHTAYIKVFYKSRKNPYQYYKSRAQCLNVQGLYDKIIITIVPNYTGKNYITHLLPLIVLCTHNNQECVIFQYSLI